MALFQISNIQRAAAHAAVVPDNHSHARICTTALRMNGMMVVPSMLMEIKAGAATTTPQTSDPWTIAARAVAVTEQSIIGSERKFDRYDNVNDF